MTEITSQDLSWILLCAFLVTTMQIGFCMLETGLVRQKNSINVAYKNLMDFVVSGLVFWVVGFGIMYGAGHESGLFGTSMFLRNHGDGQGAFFLYQLVFCSAAATVVGGAMAERTRLSGYLIISALVAAVFYPLAGHWIWGGILENGTPGWLAASGFIDLAGATVVHGVGGWLALAAVIIIGPRIGRFDEDAPPIRGSNYPIATIGVLVLWFGWFGFNGGSAYRFDASVPLILVNTSLAAAAGGFALLSGAWIKERKPNIAISLNGTVAGLVGVTGGAHLYETSEAVLVGVACATACALATRLLHRLKIDDVISAWPAHAVAGGVGTLLVAVLGDTAGFPGGNSRMDQFLIQLMGVASIALWAFGGGYILLFLLNKVLPLRVSEKDERIGLNIAEHDASTDLIELVGEMQVQRDGGDFGTPVAAEPHTEVGQIATEYNRVLERVRLEIETREEAYRQLEEASEFRFIFENAHEGIVQFARNGRVSKANPAAIALLGFRSEEETIERAGRWLAKLDGIDSDSHLKMLKPLASSGVARNIELSFVRSVDGRPGHVQFDLRRVAGADDAPTTVLASIIDISERKANDRLRVERDSATAASRAKSEFLANMSHEIRTPLNGVTGMLELLSRTTLDTRQSRFVDIAGTSADALLSVINDILDVSKIEAGKMELELIDFTLMELLDNVIDIFAPQAARKGIELASLVPTNIPSRVVGDPERIRQVFVNLIGNALKFTDEGSVTLRCRLTNRSPDQATFHFDVEDTGAGISPAERERLFEPFTQADSSTTRKHGGTGLGLTITRQLIDLMGGTIDVESELGSGTSFHIELTLPIAKASPTETPAPRPTAAPAGEWRVLAVDDHPINLELLEGLLEPEGFKVTSVDGAMAALDELEHAEKTGQPYALALLDYQMPEVDGGELARRIRDDSRFDQLRLIMLTSIDQALSATERSALKIHASITKPLRRSRLFDAIDETLGRKPDESAPVIDKPATDLVADRLAEAKSVDPSASSIQSQEATEQPANSPSGSSRLQSLRILVVEDNMVNQIVIQELLLAFNHVVLVANNGQEALDRLETEEVDMVLMDCQMPIMDGFEATRRLRDLEAASGAPRMPVIAVTANAVKGDRERCLDAGMDDYVSKPIDTAKLEESIKRHVSPKSR